MAVKKGKVTVETTVQPAKKSKSSVPAVSADEPTTETETGSRTRSKTKAERKRAADFLSDEEQDDIKQKAKVNGKPKKSKKSEKSQDQSLTADGANGVVEKVGEEDVEITTTQTPAADSLMAEAERTVDQEIEDEFGNNDNGPSDSKDKQEEEIDEAPALLAGFDSDADDVAEDKDLDTSRTAPIPNYKKTSKKLRQAATQGRSGKPGVVYVGRIPHGFYEQPMRDYFSQFGTITRLRLSRNKRTGASKHFAFIEFESDEVAKIVAETMDNYLMFGHILKCKYAPAENLHPDLWKGANKRYRRIPHGKLARQKLEAPKTEEAWRKKNVTEQKKRDRKAEQMKKLGYEFHMPELKDPAALLEEQKQIAAAAQSEALAVAKAQPEVVEQKQIEAAAPEPEPVSVSVTVSVSDVPKAEEAKTKSKASKKSRKSQESEKADVEVVVKKAEKEDKAKKAAKATKASSKTVPADVKETVTTDSKKKRSKKA